MNSIIERFMADGGYFVIAALMFLENVFPPIPSELVMPLAGYSAAQGDLSLVGVTLAGSLGSLAGAVFWFAVGWWIGADRVKRWSGRHGRWLTLTPGDIQAGQNWFCRWGGFAVLFGRLIPTVRTFISVPAGMARMSIVTFTIFTSLGTVVWTTLLAVAGYLLQRQADEVSAYLDPVSFTVLGLIVVYYLYRVLTFRVEGEREDG